MLSSSTPGGGPPRAVQGAIPEQNGSSSRAESCVEDCYRENRNRLCAFALTLTADTQAAEDIVQQAFAKTIAAVRSGVEIEDLSRWLHRVIRNLAVDWGQYRARHHHHRLLEDDLASDPRADVDPSVAFEVRATCETIKGALDEVTPRQRAALLMTSIRGLTYEETAAALNVSTGSVRQAVFRARGAIRKAVGSGRETFGLALLWLFGSRDGVSPSAVGRLRGAATTRISKVETRSPSVRASDRLLHAATQPAISVVTAAIAVSPILLAGGSPVHRADPATAGLPAPASSPAPAADQGAAPVAPADDTAANGGPRSARGEERLQAEGPAPKRVAEDSTDVSAPTKDRKKRPAKQKNGGSDAQVAGAASDSSGETEDVPADDEPEEHVPWSALTIDGPFTGDWMGWSVAGAGDMNGDGLDDVIVGASRATGRNGAESGAAYIIFGSQDTATGIDFSDPRQSLRIDGAAAGDLAGWSVAGAGDVNGDGLDDVIVGARDADANGRQGSGAAYVLFGSREPQPYAKLDLNALDDRGFQINGGAYNDNAGQSVAGAGDVNGDGLADVLVGAPRADGTSSGRMDAGSAYVVLGKKSTDPVDLGDLGLAGVRMMGATANERAGTSVAGAGDTDGDGLADVVVGAPRAGSSTSSRPDAGAAYLVHGIGRGLASSPPRTVVDLGDPTCPGILRIDGANADDQAGASVAGAGDVNGDGLADVLVGAPRADGNGRDTSGSAYVVLGARDGSGTPARLDVSQLGARGFSIDGAEGDDGAGYAVAGAGDVNGDGLADALVGAPGAGANGLRRGSAYAVFGARESKPVDLAVLADRGTRFDGADAGNFAGTSVASVGDRNGDGFRDLVVGAPFAGKHGADSGAALIVHG